MEWDWDLGIGWQRGFIPSLPSRPSVVNRQRFYHAHLMGCVHGLFSVLDRCSPKAGKFSASLYFPFFLGGLRVEGKEGGGGTGELSREVKMGLFCLNQTLVESNIATEN